MKNIRVVFSLIIAMVVLVFSTVCFAGSGNSREAVTTDEGHVLEEGGDGSEIVILQCGSDTTYNQQEIREGAPNIQYSVRTIGIRESEVDLSKNEIVNEENISRVFEVEKEGGGKKTMIGDTEARVNIMVYCLSYGEVENISLTGEGLQCNKGEGIELEVSQPESIAEIRFYAVLDLITTVYNDLPEEFAESEKSETASELTIESEPQVVSQLELLNQRWEEVRGFLEGKGYSARAIDVFHLRVNQGRQQELNSEIESLDREIQELKAQQIVLQQTQIGGPPQPTSVNPSVNLGLNLGFSGSS